MIPLLEQHRDAIAALCKKHGVARLDVFGSASDGTFDPERSDVDFIVTLTDEDAILYKRKYFALLESLEELLGRKVDLLTDDMKFNRFFKQQMELSRAELYAA